MTTRDANSNGASEGLLRCECKPWEQRWLPETYWMCARCGLPFPDKGVEARRPREGDPA